MKTFHEEMGIPDEMDIFKSYQSDGPTAVFIAGKMGDENKDGYLSIDMEQPIFVYCRSGRRSKEASKKLAAIGYKNVIEFGGILDVERQEPEAKIIN